MFVTWQSEEIGDLDSCNLPSIEFCTYWTFELSTSKTLYIALSPTLTELSFLSPAFEPSQTNHDIASFAEMQTERIWCHCTDTQGAL